MNADLPKRVRSLPAIVSIVLAQLVRGRTQGEIPDTLFNAQIERLMREELQPRGLTLLVRDLPAGRTRFLVKDAASRTVREMLDFEADGSRTEDCADEITSP